jgi:hypothetical protein
MQIDPGIREDRAIVVRVARERIELVSRAEALRRSQLALMKDPRFAHPFFWSPILVIGDWP